MKHRKLLRALEISGIVILSILGIFTVSRDGRGVSRNIIFPQVYYYKINVGEEVKLTYSVRAWTGETTAKYKTTDKTIATVSDDGTVTGLKEGRVGIEMYVSYKDKSDDGTNEPVSNILLFDIVQPETEEEIAANEALAKELRPAENDYFDVSYETESYCKIGETIKLNASYVKTDGTVITDVTWESEDTKIATVDSNGYVKGKSSGSTKIIVCVPSESKYFEFTVTILPKIMSSAMKTVVANHNSNVQTVYNLRVASYYYDFAGSVNNIIFDDLTIDKTYYDKLPIWTKNDGIIPVVDFITVHYTGNVHVGADADNNADYFNYEGYSASIHWVTGRTNLYNSYNKDDYAAFAVMNEKYAGWHASGYGYGEHKWYNTGVKYQYGDPEVPVISVSSNSNFTINGHETSIAIPDDPYSLFVEGPSYDYNGTTVNTFNKQGIAWKIENGVYYIGNTYWNPEYHTVLSNVGGNYSSIGIESCVDEGSDLNHTWHVTAQLVAQLMVKYDLDISRVVGHHFFAGKDCPQPLLENDLELWDTFIEYVEAEYDLLTKNKNATITMEVEDGGSGNLDSYGLCYQDGDAHCVTYTVTVKDGLFERTITLASIVESKYKNNSTSSHKSIQELGEDVI